jgi:hypothetical protein
MCEACALPILGTEGLLDAVGDMTVGSTAICSAGGRI